MAKRHNGLNENEKWWRSPGDCLVALQERYKWSLETAARKKKQQVNFCHLIGIRGSNFYFIIEAHVHSTVQHHIFTTDRDQDATAAHILASTYKKANILLDW